MVRELLYQNQANPVQAQLSQLYEQKNCLGKGGSPLFLYQAVFSVLRSPSHAILPVQLESPNLTTIINSHRYFPVSKTF